MNRSSHPLRKIVPHLPAVLGVLIWNGVLHGDVRAQNEPLPVPVPVDEHTVYVVSHGWHAGLLIPTVPTNGTNWINGIEMAEVPALKGFEHWAWVEIGWGDEGFYRAGSSISIGIAARAVFVPSPTVLHVVGISDPVDVAFPESEIVEIPLSDAEFSRMIRFISETFAAENGMPVDLGPGLYGSSRYFRAHGSYYFPNTCNVWTLKALQAAGKPVTPVLGVRAQNVLHQVTPFGRSVRRTPPVSPVPFWLTLLIAMPLAYRLRPAGRWFRISWIITPICGIAFAVFTMLEVNGVMLPAWARLLIPIFKHLLWAALLCTAVTAIRQLLSEGFRWRWILSTVITSLALVVIASPL